MAEAGVPGNGFDTAPHYTSVADDSSEDPKRREAAALISIAEGYLNDQEDYVEGRRAAWQAVELFKKLQDNKGVADATRVVVNSYRSEVQILVDAKDRKGGHASEQEEEHQAILEEAHQVAEEALAKFKKARDKRGEAFMLLSLSDVQSEMGAVEKKGQAKENCKCARAIFREISDKKMEAACLITMVNNHLRLWELEEAYAAACVAVEACTKLQDRKLEADALHGMGVVMSMVGMDALPTMKQVLAIWREDGPKKLEGWEAYTIANMLFKKGRLREALPFAKTAMQIMQDVNYGKGWQPMTRELLMKIYIHKGDSEKALKIAIEGLRRSLAAEPRNLKNEVLSYQNVTTVNLTLAHGGSVEDGMHAAEQSIEVCRQMGNRRWEANCWHNIAQAQLRLDNVDACLKACEESMMIFRDLDEKNDEATTMHTVADAHLKKERFDQAIKVYEDLRAIYGQFSYIQEAEATLDMARTIFVKATATKKPKLVQEALFWAEGAKEAFGQLGDFVKQGGAWDFISELQESRSSTQNAIEAAQNAAASYKSGGHWVAQASSLRTAANMMMSADMAGSAVDLAAEALSAARAGNDPLKEIEMLSLTSQAQLAKLSQSVTRDCHQDNESAINIVTAGEEMALQPAREALALSRKLRSSAHMAMSLECLAQAYVFTGHFDVALTAAEEGVDICARSGEGASQAMCLLLVAEAHFGMQHLQDADYAAQDALEICRGAGDEEGVERILQVMERFKGSPTTVAAPTLDADVNVVQASALQVKNQGMDFDMVKKIVQEQILGTLPEDDIDVAMDDPLMDIGMDSLSAVSFRETLSKEIGLPLPASLIFDYPSQKAIIDFCIEESVNRA